MKEVYLYRKLENNNVQCQNCSHYCFIVPGKRGICSVRENKNGTLYALNYGKIIALSIDPIEKKPFYHFHPGSYSLSLAAIACNFRCDNCQNWNISQPPKEAPVEGKEISPKEIVDMALKEGVPSISYTYTEPAIFSEYALDIMKIAREKRVKNLWVTNGYWSKELFNMVSSYLDGANVDLKSYSEEFYRKHCGGKLKPVLETLKRLNDKGIWIEITTLVIPTLNDSDDVFRNIAEFIKNNLGLSTPWHITQFFGGISWKLQHLPETPVETLERAYKIGKEAGLHYVYIGNMPGLEAEDTFCPNCQSLVIDRTGYMTTRHDIAGNCPKCGHNINLVLD